MNSSFVRLSFCHSFSCCPSCHLFSKPIDFLSCRGPIRFSSRRRILCSRSPRLDVPLLSMILLDLRSLLRCVQLCVSVCRCNYFCLPLASARLLSFEMTCNQRTFSCTFGAECS